jgi:hypothetical protein
VSDIAACARGLGVCGRASRSRFPAQTCTQFGRLDLRVLFDISYEASKASDDSACFVFPATISPTSDPHARHSCLPV